MKILPTASASRLLWGLLNGASQPSQLYKKCPRCMLQCGLKWQHTTLTTQIIGSQQYPKINLLSNGKNVAMVTDTKGTWLQGNWVSVKPYVTARGFCDAKNEDLCDHGSDFAPVQNVVLDSVEPAEEILEEDNKLSGTSNTEPDTGLMDNEMSVPAQTELNSHTQDERQLVEDFEGKGSASMHALTRTEFDELEADLQEDARLDILAKQDSPTVLEEFIQPLLPSRTLSLAAYADHSPTLQKLVELGVNLLKVGRKAKIGTALMKLDFERDIQDKIVLLHLVGIKSGEGLGRFLTINSFVLTEDLANLESRLQYLRSKNFSESAITQILNRAPYFISFSVERVDSKLGFFQRELSLTGDQIRHVITKMPKLVTFKIQRIKENIFVIRQQLGFSAQELKNLVLHEPKVLLAGKEKLIGIFDYLHNHMNIPHKHLLKNPQVFNGRVFRLQERHQFLKQLGRAQYDPTQPGYVSIEHLAKFPDHVFCKEIAKTTLEEYNQFLKTL